MVSAIFDKITLPKGGAFGILQQAKKAESIYGKNKVINSVLGTIYDEEEKFVCFKTIQNVYSQLNTADIFPYASGITGSKQYQESVKKFIFGENLDAMKSYIEVVATVAGTGAIYTAVKLYVNKNDTVLLPNYRWEVYEQIVASNEAKFESYSLFNKNKMFNISDFKKRINNILKTQDSIFIIINDPCQNPSGYSLKYEEWQEIITFLKTINKNKQIYLLDDIAYLPYDNRGDAETKKIFPLFDDLPNNINILIAFSISKLFTSYGLRAGALISISNSKKTIQDFKDYASYICRSTWSNTPRGAMELFVKIINDSKLYNSFNSEKQKIINIMKKRSNIFIQEADKVKLDYLPYKSGFFFTLPLKKTIINAVVADLQKQNIFVLPLFNAIRIAICSTPANKIKLLPEALENTIKKFINR